MAVSSYGSSTSSSGVVRILKDLDRDIHDRDVLIVEDVVDSGLTLSWLLRNLKSRHPRSLRVCTLLRKPEAVGANVDITYVGFDIPNEFVVGYGLDYDERYRDLSYIGTLDPGSTSSPLIQLPDRCHRKVHRLLARFQGQGGRARAGAWGASTGAGPVDSEIEITLPKVSPDSSAYCWARFLASS